MRQHLPRHLADRLCAGVILSHFVLVGWWISSSFAVVDEAAHIASGYATWRTGELRPYCVNPPLPRLVASLPFWAVEPSISSEVVGPPGYRPEWGLAVSLARDNQDRYVSLVRMARVANLSWSALLLVVLARWSGDLYGPWGRFISVTLWCWDPTCIAFSGVVVPDVPAAAAGLLTSYVFWRYLRRPGWLMAWLSGLTLGMALLTKFTWILLFAVWPALFLCALISPPGAADRAGLPSPSAGGAGPPRPGVRHFSAILVGSWFVFCAGYGFDQMGHSLGSFDFVSASLKGTDRTSDELPIQTNRFRQTSVAGVPLPLPAEALIGIDVQKHDFERGMPSYLNGEWRNRGWWYYYLYAVVIKLPVPTVLLVLAGIFWCLAAPKSPGRVDEWCFVVPAAAVIAFVSSQTGFNHHMRYVLPAFPFLFLAAGRLALLSEYHTWLRGVIAGLIVWCGCAVLTVAPFFMSYFSPLGGGPSWGWRRLVDSNIDWGQDLLHLQRWVADHPEARPLGVKYYNLIEPGHLGFSFSRVPIEPTPGWYAVDVNYVVGSQLNVGDGRTLRRIGMFSYFMYFEPVDKAGYSIFIYNISPEQANQVRATMGLPPWAPDPDGVQ
jgi:hypothetical protein